MRLTHVWSILVAAGLGFSLVAHAANKKRKYTTNESQPQPSLHDQFTGQRYGMAGCGLGSIAFADKPGMIQVVAATLNGTAGNQTFGISSGTSNCGQSGYKQDQAALFIEVNQHALARDVSRGQGEALQSFAKLVGCQPENLGSALKQNYDRVFSGEDAASTTQAIFGVIKSNAQLQQCSTLGLG